MFTPKTPSFSGACIITNSTNDSTTRYWHEIGSRTLIPSPYSAFARATGGSARDWNSPWARTSEMQTNISVKLVVANRSGDAVGNSLDIRIKPTCHFAGAIKPKPKTNPALLKFSEDFRELCQITYDRLSVV